MGLLVVMVVFVLVVVLISAPLVRGVRPAKAEEGADLLDLEAARDAKYQEIRDAELDHQTGKLSAEDFAKVNRTLRAEAIAILKQLDRYHRQG